MNAYIKEYLDQCDYYKQSKMAMTAFMNYCQQQKIKLKDRKYIKSIQRDLHIHDLKGVNYTFREYLKSHVKNNNSRNTILLALQRFFDYEIYNLATNSE